MSEIVYHSFINDYVLHITYNNEKAATLLTKVQSNVETDKCIIHYHVGDAVEAALKFMVCIAMKVTFPQLIDDLIK
jgi:predicted AlkP superfamily phosphohydrolase/phosphomutase